MGWLGWGRWGFWCGVDGEGGAIFGLRRVSVVPFVEMDEKSSPLLYLGNHGVSI